MGYRSAIVDGLGLKGSRVSKSEINNRGKQLVVRDKQIVLDFVIGPSCSYQTTFELVRKAFLKLLPFKIFFGFGFR